MKPKSNSAYNKNIQKKVTLATNDQERMYLLGNLSSLGVLDVTNLVISPPNVHTLLKV